LWLGPWLIKSGQVLDVFLKTQQRGITDGMELGRESKKGKMDDSQVLPRTAGKMELPSTE
jgi:hypothetical protein